MCSRKAVVLRTALDRPAFTLMSMTHFDHLGIRELRCGMASLSLAVIIDCADLPWLVWDCSCRNTSQQRRGRRSPVDVCITVIALAPLMFLKRLRVAQIGISGISAHAVTRGFARK